MYVSEFIKACQKTKIQTIFLTSYELDQNKRMNNVPLCEEAYPSIFQNLAH